MYTKRKSYNNKRFQCTIGSILHNSMSKLSCLLKWKFRVNVVLFNSIKTMITVVFSFSVIYVNIINYILSHQTGHAVGT